jgi:hypothetical protein
MTPFPVETSVRLVVQMSDGSTTTLDVPRINVTGRHAIAWELYKRDEDEPEIGEVDRVQRPRPNYMRLLVNGLLLKGDAPDGHLYTITTSEPPS